MLDGADPVVTEAKIVTSYDKDRSRWASWRTSWSSWKRTFATCSQI